MILRYLEGWGSPLFKADSFKSSGLVGGGGEAGGRWAGPETAEGFQCPQGCKLGGVARVEVMGICAPLSSPSPLQEKEPPSRRRTGEPGPDWCLGCRRVREMGKVPGRRGVGKLIPGVSGTTMKGCSAMTQYPQDEPPAPWSHPITCFQGPFSLCKSPRGRCEKRTSVTQLSHRWKDARSLL